MSFKLEIPMNIYSQVMDLVLACDIEVSGYGTLERTANGFTVKKVYLPKQECTGVTTEIAAQDMAKIEMDAIKDGGDLIWWWHSHVDMATRFSGVDLQTISDAQKHDGGRIIATVFNKHFDMYTDYAAAASVDGMYPAVTIRDVETVIVPTDNAKSAIKQAVQVKTFKQKPKNNKAKLNEINAKLDKINELNKQKANANRQATFLLDDVTDTGTYNTALEVFLGNGAKDTVAKVMAEDYVDDYGIDSPYLMEEYYQDNKEFYNE